MPSRNHRDEQHSDPDQERVSVDDDIHETMDLIDTLVGDDDVRTEGVSDAGDPDAAVFDSSGTENSLSEQAKEDYTLLRHRRIDGARAYMRDLVPPIAMWLLLATGAIIGSDLAIEAAGPSAGPLWEFRMGVITSVWLPVVDAVTGLPDITENELLLVGVLLVAGLAIHRVRRW